MVAWLLSRPGLNTAVKMIAGAFGILGSYGIAAAEYHDIVSPIMYREGPGGLGLSWVAVWALLGAVVVPSPPRITLLSSALSLSAVPVMYSLGGNLPIKDEKVVAAVESMRRSEETLQRARLKTRIADSERNGQMDEALRLMSQLQGLERAARGRT